jgi:hypothetical protein
VANHGSNKVARNLMHWFEGTTLVCDPIGDHSELLAYVDRQLYAVVQLSIDENLVKRIHVIADPAKLDAISATTR